MSVCLKCGGSLEHVKGGSKFCSTRCKNAYNYQRSKQAPTEAAPLATPQLAGDSASKLLMLLLETQQEGNALLREQNELLKAQLKQRSVTVEREIVREKVTFDSSDEDILEGVTVQRSTSTDSGTNFRLQMLYNGDPRNLKYFKLEDLQYALNLPQVFPSDLINTELATRPKPAQSAKKLQGADIELTPPPDIDDLDLL